MSKKLTIEELRKAQDLQAELLGMLSAKVGDKASWTVEVTTMNLTDIHHELAKVTVIIDNKIMDAVFTDWAGERTPDNLKANFTAYIDENFNTSIQ